MFPTTTIPDQGINHLDVFLRNQLVFSSTLRLPVPLLLDMLSSTPLHYDLTIPLGIEESDRIKNPCHPHIIRRYFPCFEEKRHFIKGEGRSAQSAECAVRSSFSFLGPGDEFAGVNRSLYFSKLEYRMTARIPPVTKTSARS